MQVDQTHALQPFLWRQNSRRRCRQISSCASANCNDGVARRARRETVGYIRTARWFILGLFATVLWMPSSVWASSNPLELNGGSCMAMAGKGCVALAVDRRFGLEGQLVSADARRVLKVHRHLLCGFTGLWTDVMTVMQDLSYEVALKGLGESDRPISPMALAALLSTLLYAKRSSPFFVEPIIAGLDFGGRPYLCGQDILGAPVEVDDFVVAGTSAQSLYGTCEAFFKKGMDPEELFKTASRCLMAALDRDCLSGYGAVVHLITARGVEVREVATRMD